MLEMNIQWKGTDLCADFVCECGHQNHVDGLFGFAVKCGKCGQVYITTPIVTLTKPEDFSGSDVDYWVNHPLEAAWDLEGAN